MLENNSQLNRIKVSDISSGIMKILYESCYGASIVVNTTNVVDLMLAAAKFDFHDVKFKCIEFFALNLTTDNCLPIWVWSECINIKSFRNTVMQYMFHKFLDIAQTEYYLGLDPNRVLHILSADNLGIQKEWDVLTALLCWLEHDMAKRKRYFRILIRGVRLQYIGEKVRHYL